MTLSDLVRRSSLGTGWYILRDDENCPVPDAGNALYEAVIAAGACSVHHGGMYEPETRATALPGGCLYQMLLPYGFSCLPPRAWIFGARALRHALRLIAFEQPCRRLSGEVDIPTLSGLSHDWGDFVAQDGLVKVSASLGALVWVDLSWLPWGRIAQPDHFDPLPLPILWSQDSPPEGVEVQPVDPRFKDDIYWTSEYTSVRDCTGVYSLRPESGLEPEKA